MIVHRLALPLLVLCLTAVPARGADEIPAAALTDEHVQATIDALVEELYRRKQPRHFWDPEAWTFRKHGSESQVGGYTAIAVLGLLYAGQSYQDPRLQDAIEHLAKYPMEGTYAYALRTHVWALLPDRFRELLARDTTWLLDGFSHRAAGWDYDFDPKTTRQDHSIRQYGALALWESSKRGARIDRRYWHQLEDAFLDTQLADGGWNYKGDEAPPRGSMTAAGLTVLFITQDLLHAGDDVELGRGKVSRTSKAIERGLAWMDANFSPTENPGRPLDFFYYLYGVERVGLASGYREFGGRDWFREGAAEVIRRVGAWDEASRTMTINTNVAGDGRATTLQVHHLAFSLMFLSRGRAPVGFNKLEVPDLAWNNRPRDVANLTDWIQRRVESATTWQVVSATNEPERWLDAAVLYAASDQPLPWAGPARVEAGAPIAPELARLKRYLDLGGLLLAVNEGQSSRFAESIERAGSRMYPDCTWTIAPDDHWSYRLAHPIAGRKPPLRVLSNGVRDLIVLSHRTDLSRTFQGRLDKHESHFQIAANAYFYASEKGRPRPRLAALEPDVVAIDPAARKLTIVRASYAGNWNPEPLALEAFARTARARDGLDIAVADHPLAGIATIAPAPALVTVGGVAAHEFTPAELDAVRAYVDAGGVILFESIGGTGEFALGAEQMSIDLFSQAPRSVNRSRIVSGEDLDGATRLARIGYRPYALERFGARETAPRLRGLTIAGQPRVLISREDLTFGLLSRPCWGISGYTPDSARALFGNIVRHAARLRADAVTPPPPPRPPHETQSPG